MHKMDFNGWPLEKLWELHEKVRGILEQKLIEQRQALDQQLQHLSLGGEAAESNAVAEQSTKASGTKPRKPYPKVNPVYQNPNDVTETWSGRGNKPRWLAAKLQAGRTLEEFRIAAQLERRGRVQRDR